MVTDLTQGRVRDVGWSNQKVLPTVLEYKPEVPLGNLNAGLIACQFS
jgi:hypothetical protein